MSDNFIRKYCTQIKINNITKIKDKTLLKKFLNRLSVWETNNRTGSKYITWEAYTYDKDLDELTIHNGVNDSTLMYYFPTYKIEDYELNGNPSKNIKISLLINPRNDLQKQSIRFLLDNIEESQLFLCLKPGEGKTYCAINYITVKKLVPIVIVDNNKLINQWKESFMKFTDIKEEEIFSISGSTSISKLLSLKDTSCYKIFIASHRTIQSYYEDKWELLDDLFSKLGIGIKIFDEAHVEWRNIFSIDTNSNIQYNIYLTATPNRSNQNEQSVYSMMFGKINAFGLDDEIRKSKYINVLNYTWNSYPTETDQLEMKRNGYGFDNNHYNDYLLSDSKIVKFASELDFIINSFQLKQNEKIAIVFNCNNMIEYFNSYFSEKYGKENIGMFCGLIPLKERDKQLEKPIILTTIKGFNKGVDVKNLAIVINTVNTSSEVIMEQLSGRLRYNSKFKSYFIQMTDKGFRSFNSNSKLRLKFLEKIANSITDIKD